jgi:hypothetical protein
MGFLDILRGKRELKQPAPDRLFAMSTAYVKMDMELSLRSSGKAAIVFQPLATADFDGIVRDMEEVVRATGSDSGKLRLDHLLSREYGQASRDGLGCLPWSTVGPFDGRSWFHHRT